MWSKFRRTIVATMVTTLLVSVLATGSALAAKPAQPTLTVSSSPTEVSALDAPLQAGGTAYLSGCGYQDGRIQLTMYTEGSSLIPGWDATASGGCFTSSHELWWAGTYRFQALQQKGRFWYVVAETYITVQ